MGLFALDQFHVLYSSRMVVCLQAISSSAPSTHCIRRSYPGLSHASRWGIDLLRHYVLCSFDLEGTHLPKMPRVSPSAKESVALCTNGSPRELGLMPIYVRFGLEADLNPVEARAR